MSAREKTCSEDFRGAEAGEKRPGWLKVIDLVEESWATSLPVDVGESERRARRVASLKRWVPARTSVDETCQDSEQKDSKEEQVEGAGVRGSFI